MVGGTGIEPVTPCVSSKITESAISMTIQDHSLFSLSQTPQVRFLQSPQNPLRGIFVLGQILDTKKDGAGAPPKSNHREWVKEDSL